MALPAAAKSGFTLEDLTKMGPDEITRKRKLAEALLAESQGIRRIEHPLQGMAQMAQALIGNLKEARLDRAEREGRSGADNMFSAAFGGGEFPPAPGGGSAPVAANDPYAGMADGSKGQEAYAPGDDYFSKIRAAESGGSDSAKNPNSSATGRYQFIASTWDGVRRNHPELGLTADGRLDPNQQEKAIRAFTADNAKELASAGIPLTGGNLYAAHFLGSGGAKKVLSSDPSASVASIVGSDVVNANPFLRGMTVADFSRWAAKKGGNQTVALDGAAPPATAGQALEALAAPQQVASLDPAIGMPQPNQAAIGQALVEQGIDPNGPQAQAFAALQQGGGVPPVAPPAAQVPIPAAAAGVPVAPVGQATPPPAQAQLAQALTGGQPDIGLTMGAQPITPGGPDINTLMQLSGNEFMSPQQQKMIEALTGQRLQQADPAYQMELEQKRLQLDALKNPKPDYKFISGKDGAIFRADQSGNVEQVYGGKPDTFKVLTPQQELEMGLDPAGTYQQGADNKISKIGGEGTTVNIDQKAEGSFEKKLAEKQAETFDAMSTEGMNAKADLGIISELETLLQGQGGTLSGLAGIAAKYGLGGEGLSDLQATQALINKLVPTQRQPGSGTMSDRDVELFTRSLPSLWNQPGGNEKILKVMRGLATYKQAQGEIADQILMGEISRQEGRKLLRSLPNPLEGIKSPARKAFDDAAAGKTIMKNGYKIEPVD